MHCHMVALKLSFLSSIPVFSMTGLTLDVTLSLEPCKGVTYGVAKTFCLHPDACGWASAQAVVFEIFPHLLHYSACLLRLRNGTV